MDRKQGVHTVETQRSSWLDKRSESLYIWKSFRKNGNVEPEKGCFWTLATASQPPPFKRNLKSVASAERTRLSLLEL